MVIIVAIGLAFTHQVLSEKQTANVNIDKMQQILRSLRVDASPTEADGIYRSLIKSAYLISPDGNKIEGTEGIEPPIPPSRAKVRDWLFTGTEVEGSKKYVIPMQGTGLWGPIWGYLSIESNGSTVYGSGFGHAGETLDWVQRLSIQPSGQFNGKELIKNGEFKSIAVVKPGQSNSEGIMSTASRAEPSPARGSTQCCSKAWDNTRIFYCNSTMPDSSSAFTIKR